MDPIPNLSEPLLFGPRSLNIGLRWWRWLKPLGTKPVWQLAALQNGWVNYGGGYAPAEYSIDALNVVRLRGLIKSGTTTSGTVLLNVPAGFRPPYSLDLMAFSDNAGTTTTVGMDMLVNGNLTIRGVPGNTWFSLDSISYTTY
jgi:hypothetical protein